MKLHALLLLPLALLAGRASAINMVVVEARAAGLKPGMMISSTAPVTLKEGETLKLPGVLSPGK